MAVIGKTFRLCHSIRHFSTMTKENGYFEHIPDLRALDTYNRDLIIHQTYTTFLTVLRALSFQDYLDLILDPKNILSSILLLRERRFNTIIGYNFYPVQEFYYKDNDRSEKNRYITSGYYPIAIQPNFKSHNLGKTLFVISELLLKQHFKESNRVTFNTTFNPVLYEQRAQLTPFYVPGPNTMPNKHPENFLKKIIKDHGYECLSEEKPFIKIYNNACVIGYDAKDNLKKIGKVSESQRYIIEQLEGNNDWTLCNLAIFNLIKDNTLELTPGEYFAHGPVDYDIFDYSTRKPIKL